MTATLRLSYPSLILNSTLSHPLEYLALVGGVVACLYRCYLWALPKPILAIPRTKEATKSLFGDASPMVQSAVNSQELHSRKGKKSVRLQCPDECLATRPSGRPCVLITDLRQARDVMAQKTKETDGAELINTVSGGILPKTQLSVASHNDFRSHRKWLQGLMGVGFLMGLLVRLCTRRA